MAITTISTFDTCERPNCPEDIVLEFVSYPNDACHLDTLSVSWRIIGTSEIPSSTKIYYSVNDDSLNNDIDSLADDGDYSPGDLLYSVLPAAGETGVVYIEARAIINGVIYFSEKATVIIVECD